MDKIFFILFKISSPPKISKYAKTSSCSEWSENIIKRIYFVESAKPQNHPTIPDMPQTKSNRLLTLPTQYPRLLHTIHDFYTLSTTSTHYPRLLHTTHIFHTPPTTYTHPAEVSPGLPMTAIHHPRLPHTTYELRLLHATYDFYTLPTTSTHHPRLLHVNYDFYTPPTTSTRHLRLLQPPPPTSSLGGK